MAGGSIEGREALMLKLRAGHAQLRSRLEKAVIIGASMVETTAKDNIRKNNSVVPGNLFQSVVTVTKGSENEFVALVGSAVAYAAAYEYGMSASEGDFHSPAFAAAILEWVKIKHIDADWGMSAEETAFVIVRHIQEYGTRPHPFLIPAYQAHQAEIADLLKRAVSGGSDVS
jgi:phage gpG-like protein